MKKSIILLSAGLDSTVNFCKALRETEVILGLTFDYGQRSAQKELLYAKAICNKYYVSHRSITLEYLRDLTHTALVNKERDLPKISEFLLDDFTETSKTARSVWVPNRNGIFINIAAAFAESLGADEIVVGFNAEEAKTFPDNSEVFLNRVNDSLEFSTLKKPRVVCYTTDFSKREIALFGRELRAPFDLMWSCYEAGEKMCGECESCLRYLRAIRHLSFC